MITFLIVDDKEDTREGISKLVDGSAFGVETKFVFASTLEEALQKTIEENPHLTFLDIGLPGQTLENVISSIPKFLPPVIVVSAYPPDYRLNNGKTIMAECLKAGAEEYIQKGSRDFLETQVKAFTTVLKKYGGSKQYEASPI